MEPEAGGPLIEFVSNTENAQRPKGAQGGEA
jgi:hypothetical protein